MHGVRRGAWAKRAIPVLVPALAAALATWFACVASPARAGVLRLEPWRGHVSIGYAHLFSAHQNNIRLGVCAIDQIFHRDPLREHNGLVLSCHFLWAADQDLKSRIRSQAAGPR